MSNNIENIPIEEAISPAAAEEKAPKNRRSRFWLGFGIYAAVFAVIVASALVVFWNFIKSYELSRPDTVMQDFVASTDEAYWLDLVSENAQTPLSEFEDSAALIDELLLSEIRGEEISFGKHSGVNTAASPAYIVSAGDCRFCSVKLVPDESRSLGFGFTAWKLGEIELLDAFVYPPSRTLELTVKEDAKVVLNGKALSEKYALSDDDDYINVYRVENIYKDYTLEVYNAEGSAESPETVNGDSYIYPIPSKEEFTFNIIVPDGARVTAGDTLLSADYLVSEKNTYPLWDDLQELTALDSLAADARERIASILDSQPHFSRYSYTVLDYVRPQLRAVSAAGDELSCTVIGEDTFVFSVSSESTEQDVAERAENYIRKYISFSTNAGKDTFGNLYAVISQALRDTKLYDRLVGSTDGMRWVSGRVVTYNSLEVKDIIVYDGILATCRVYFSINDITGQGTNITEGTYDLALVKNKGQWQVASMIDVKSYQ